MMNRTDYENVQRILKALPVENGVRLNAVVSATQLFSSSNPKMFNRIKFCEGAGTYPCKVQNCLYVFDHEDDLQFHMEDNHEAPTKVSK